MGHWQVNSKAVVGEKQDKDSQLKKADHQVAGVNKELALQILNIAKEKEEDKKLLEEVDREAIDNNLTTMMMANEW